jgi:hypothetical protein
MLPPDVREDRRAPSAKLPAVPARYWRRPRPPRARGRLVIGVSAKSFSDGLLTRPELLGEIAGHDRRLFALRAIVIIEIAAILEGQVDGREVAGVLDQERSLWAMLRIVRRAVFEFDVPPAGARLRRVTHNCCPGGARQSANLSDQMVEEPCANLRVGVARTGQAKTGGEDLTRRNFGIEQEIVEEAADEESRAGEQDKCQRELADYQLGGEIRAAVRSGGARAILEAGVEIDAR